MAKTETQKCVKEEGIGGGEKRRKTGRREKKFKREIYRSTLRHNKIVRFFLSYLNSKHNSFRDKLKL